MAEKAGINKKTLIGIVVAVVAVITLVTGFFLVRQGSIIDDNYFKSNDKKLVLNIDEENLAADHSEEYYGAKKQHIVVFVDKDKITGMKVFYEYTDTAAAKEAFNKNKEKIKAADKEEGKSIKEVVLNGKYIVLTATEKGYENMTVDEVKKAINLFESLKKLNTNNDGTIKEQTDNTKNNKNTETTK